MAARDHQESRAGSTGIKGDGSEPISSLVGRGAEVYAPDIEAAIRGGRYESIVLVSLKAAVEKLSRDDRRLLVSKYVRAQRAAAIASATGVHPSTVSRQIQRVHEKLREEILSQLRSRGSLGPGALQECVRDIIENPMHSILALIE